MQSVSIVGCGYTGVRLAARWRDAGVPVRGYATRRESLAQIAAAGAAAVPLDLDAAVDSIDVDGQLVYYMVPPANTGGDPRLRRFLAHLSGSPQRFVYLSTTGIYGDQAGASVDEDTPPAPVTERAARRLEAENIVQEWARTSHASWCVLRVAGIYGPGRLPLDRLRRAEPAILLQQAPPGNRIHVTDLVAACMAAGIAARADRRIYNIADGNPASVTDYLGRLARIANLPSPPQVSRADAQRTIPKSRVSSEESRRIDNRRMLEELELTLTYRDLDAGIRASLTES